MTVSLSWLILTLTTASPGPTGPAPDAPAAATATDPEARAEQAAELYGQRKYLEAAQILEELWASVHEPRDLFNAGLARLALGHRAHALRYWELYLKQPNIPEDGREQAMSRSKKAQAAATGVIVRLAPSAVAEVGATLELVRTDEEKDRRPPLVFELEAHAPEFSSGGRTIYLDPGKWQLRIGAKTYVTATRDLVIKPGAPGFMLDVVLASDPNFRYATFQVEPAEAVAAGATVTVQRIALNAEPVPCVLDGKGKCGVRVEPGDWEVTVQAPGYQRHVEKFTLGQQPVSTFAVALAPAVADPPPAAPAEPTPAEGEATQTPVEGPPAAPAVPERVPKKTRIKVSAALVTSGIPLFITGLALAVHGSNVYDQTKQNLMTNGDLVPAIRLRAAGSGLMGTAVGLWATGLTAEYDVKPFVWWTELGVGVAALVAGGAWSGVTSARWNNNQIHTLACNNNQGVDCFTAHRLGAGFFIGLGAGAIFGASTGLVLQSLHKKPAKISLAPTFGAGQGGLVVTGRF